MSRTMQPFAICGACSRHVRATEASCPFCGSGLLALESVPVTERVSRSALYALGVALTTGAVACGPTPAVAVYGGPPPEQSAQPAPSADAPNGESSPSAGSAGAVEPLPSGSVLVPESTAVAPSPSSTVARTEPTSKPAPTATTHPPAPVYGGPPPRTPR